MPRILLIGAGFSRNWDGWLASEIMGKIQSDLHADAELAHLLRNGDYESALSVVQSDYISNQSSANEVKLEHLQNAVINIFNRMNKAFSELHSMEFSNSVQYSINAFLARFDAIFSLNQDLLLEFHYKIEPAYSRRWSGCQYPGLQLPTNYHSLFNCEKLAEKWISVDKQEFLVNTNAQPIFKLHGSVNWIDKNNRKLLVMGGNKFGTIQRSDLLSWYFGKFREHLSVPNTHLMTIGYGYKDDHVNKMIIDAANTQGFGLYVVDPLGRKILNRQRLEHPNAIGLRDNDLELITSVGESTRTLKAVFSGDIVEHPELLRFFE